MKLLDLFCGAGGCSEGYYRAGFEVVGVDIEPQPNYPFTFIQGDALNPPVDLQGFDVIHASRPCQHYSVLTPLDRKNGHPDLIEPVRDMLLDSGVPFVIENVPGAKAKLVNPIMLCGTNFGLHTQRHRYFEIHPEFDTLALVAPCQHYSEPILMSGRGMRKSKEGKRYPGSTVAERQWASEIDWMTGDELTQAIPPSYTEWIGKQLIAMLNRSEVQDG